MYGCVIINSISLDKWFILTFSSGAEVTAHLNEETTWSTLYTNAETVQSLGQEFSIGIDVAFSGGGCEAVMESFHGIEKSQQMSGHQSNEVLVYHAIVDWCTPHSISSPPMMEAIADLYKL